MKIAFVGQKGIPSVTGGVEKHVEELATRLIKYDHEVIAYTRRNYTPKSMKEYKGVKLISLPSVSKKNLDAITHTFLACLDLIFRSKVDVIHFHSIGPSSLIWLVKLFKPRTPVVATFHTQCYHHQKWSWFARWYLKFGEKVICSLPDKTIAISKTLTGYAKEKYEREAVYIPNGITMPQKMDADIIKKWGLKKDNYIVSISRLVRHKGIHHLIRAYNKITTDKKLVIVGGSSYTDDYVDDLKELAKGNDSIIFTGNQSGDALVELFSNAYAFIQPSESEGLSIALLEAMSYKLPVLVSDIPENVEAVGNDGYIFRNKDIDDLSLKLELLLRNVVKVKISGMKSSERVENDYNWDKIAEEVSCQYDLLFGSLNKVRVIPSVLETLKKTFKLLIA